MKTHKNKKKKQVDSVVVKIYTPKLFHKITMIEIPMAVWRSIQTNKTKTNNSFYMEI